MRKRYRGRRGRSLMVHHYKRMLTGNFADWPTGAVANTSMRITGALGFTPWLGTFLLRGVSDVINSGDFTGLYDQYRVNKLVLKFYLKVDPGAQSAATANVPRLYWYRDCDDSSSPGSLNEIRENATAKVAVLSLTRPVTVVLRPNVLNTVYSSNLLSNYQPKWKQWLDMSVPSTNHYCSKFGIDDLSNTNYRVEVEGTLYFSCRQPR